MSLRGDCVARGSRRADRWLVAVYAAFNLTAAAILAVGLGDRRTWLAPIWPPLFAAAGVACALFALRLRSTERLAWSGALTVAAYVGRAAVLVVGWARGDLDIVEARAALATILWLFVAVTTGFVWVNVLKPAASDRRSRPRR